MEFSKEFLQIYASASLKEVEDEALEQGIEQTILAIHHKMGFNAEQIANITTHKVEYIQSVLDKFYKGNG